MTGWLGVRNNNEVLIKQKDDRTTNPASGLFYKVQGCHIIIDVFDLQLFYYVQVRTNTFGKGMNLLSPRAISYIESLSLLQA